MASTDQFIMIKGARVSYPHLFERPVINGDTGKCGAKLILHPKKHAKVIAQLEAQAEQLIQGKLQGKKMPSERRCLRNGDDLDKPEYEGHMVLSANSKNKPVVVGKDGTTVITSAEDSAIYPGCDVNAKVRLWAQNNTHGKRINGELVSIQFAGDNEPLDNSYVSVDSAMEGFDDIDEDDDGFLDD